MVPHFRRKGQRKNDTGIPLRRAVAQIVGSNESFERPIKKCSAICDLDRIGLSEAEGSSAIWLYFAA